MSHLNNGNCEKCVEVFNKYPGVNSDLVAWFFSVQSQVQEFHACEAGRNEIDQEKDFARGASKAHFGESSHNFNCAVDTFFLIAGAYNLDEAQYERVVPLISSNIAWYGAKGAKFYERPHFEIENWRTLVANGQAILIK